MDFVLLGPIAVRRDGVDVALGGPKPRALLAMLLLEANQPVSRDRLMEGLWGERLPASADHGLDDYVSRLRKALGAERIERRAPGYVVRLEPGELDLERFETLAEQGRAALASTSNGEASRILREALALWRGPALADVLDEPFAALAARRLEEERQLTLEDRIEADLAAGAGAALLPELQRLVREHPLRERLTGQLMRALYRAGRQADALEAFQAIRYRLAEELGLEPSPQLRALQRQVLDQDASLDGHRTSAGDRAPPPRSQERRRRTAALLAGAAALSVIAGSLLGIGRSGGSIDSANGGDRLVALSAGSGDVASSAALAGAPSTLAAGAGGIWVAAPAQRAILRSDPTSGAVVDRIPLPDAPGKLAVGGGSVWVATGLGRTVVRIDPTTGTLSQTIHFGIEPAAIAFGEGALWVADPGDHALLRIDPGSGIVRRTVTLPARPSAVAVGPGAVWVASHDDGTVTRVDPRSNEVVETIAVGQGPVALEVSPDAVWVANNLDGTVSRIDTHTAHVVATVPTGSGATDLARAGESIWVANQYSQTVSVLDARRNAVRRTVRVNGEPVALATAGGKTWVGVRGLVDHRGGRLVLLFSRRYLSIDPQVDYERPPAQYLGLAHDGLVAWDHSEGPDGLELVPDLALKLPVPADDGRTYRFRLRPGIRYSDGRFVKASDFVRSIRRLGAVHSPAVAQLEQLRSRGGVAADDVAGTVTFRLSSPDPDFLLKLASGLIVPVPPGTSMHDVGEAPMPGTGPYKIASVDDRRVRFVRNPRFREWSRAAQPDGNPDVIEWRFGLTPAEQVRAIAAGRADFSDEPPRDLEAVARLRSGVLHSKAFPVTTFIQINTRRAPFDDVRARRALNYAVDRARVAREYGGPLAATPTCQVLPPGVAGYNRYCPYTIHPGQEGRWRGPDMKSARALVAASGTRGARVTLWTVSDSGSPEPGTRYLVGLLRRLGYRAELRLVSSKGQSHLSPAVRARTQLLPVAFGPDYPSAFAFFSTFISCNGVFTWHQFCDPRFDRVMRRAQLLGLSDRAASRRLWARLDRVAVDKAIWVPLVNQRIVDFVSRRVRGYQNSPIYHFLPAQAWIPGR